MNANDHSDLEQPIPFAKLCDDVLDNVLEFLLGDFNYIKSLLPPDAGRSGIVVGNRDESDKSRELSQRFGEFIEMISLLRLVNRTIALLTDKLCFVSLSQAVKYKAPNYLNFILSCWVTKNKTEMKMLLPEVRELTGINSPGFYQSHSQLIGFLNFLIQLPVMWKVGKGVRSDFGSVACSVASCVVVFSVLSVGINLGAYVGMSLVRKSPLLHKVVGGSWLKDCQELDDRMRICASTSALLRRLQCRVAEDWSGFFCQDQSDSCNQEMADSQQTLGFNLGKK